MAILMLNRFNDMIDDKLIQSVWEKGRIVENYDKDNFRVDSCGAWIARTDYGNRNSSYGWEIDHVFPLSRGGGDVIDNLRPLHWQNNVSKGDDYPSYMATVKADGSKNITIERQLKVNDKLVQIISKIYK